MVAVLATVSCMHRLMTDQVHVLTDEKDVHSYTAVPQHEQQQSLLDSNVM